MFARGAGYWWPMSVAVAFLLFLLTGTLVPANRHFRQTPDGVPVYVVSNGFHTDVVVPIREARSGTNWLRHFPDSTFQARFGRYQYLALGWGNEQFYLASYNHRRPGLGAVLQALAPSRTLIHVDFYRQAPAAGPRVVPLRLSVPQYQRLVQQLEASFEPDSTGRYRLRNAAGYTSEDFFFRAQGRYHALRTCNDWTNRSLRRAGIRSALKAPLAGSVLFQVRRAK